MEDHEKELYRAFGKTIRARRLLKNMTQEDLSQESSLSTSQISQIENGIAEFRYATLLKLAKGLHLKSPADLFTDQEILKLYKKMDAKLK